MDDFDLRLAARLDLVRVAARRGWRSAYATSAWTTIGSNVLVGVAGVIAARALGPEQRGLLAIAIVWSSVAGSLSAYGMPDAATYFSARDGLDPPRAASTTLAIAAVAGLVVAGVGAAVALLFVGGASAVPMAIAFAGMLPNLVAGAAVGTVLGLGRYRAWGLLRMVQPGLTMAGTLMATMLGWATAVAITTVISATHAVSLAAFGVYLRRLSQLHRPARRLVQPVLSYMWRSVSSGALAITSTRLDQLVLSIVVVPQLLGLYAVAMSFGAVILPVAGSASRVVIQRVSAEGATAVRQTVQRGILVAMLVVGAVGGATFAAAPQLVRLLFGEDFAGAVTSLRILLVGTLALAVSSVFAAALSGLGRPLARAPAELLGALTTVVLLPLLLPRFGIEGAALASTLSYTVVMTALALILRRETQRARSVQPPT